MSAPHTPGPWVVIPARPYDGDDPALEGSFEALAGIEGADGSPVCVFGDASGSATMFENEADYPLIAAAPDLLRVLSNSCCFGCGTRFADNSDDALKMSRGCVSCTAQRAAIFKATGGAA